VDKVCALLTEETRPCLREQRVWLRR